MSTRWAIARNLCIALTGVFFVAWILLLSLGGAAGSDWKALNRIELPVGSNSSFAVDSKGNLYWGSVGLSRIQVYDPHGRFVRSWAAGIPGKPFQVVVDDRDRVLAVANHGGMVHAFEADGTYLGRWTVAQVTRRVEQQSFAGQPYALGRLPFLWPAITKRTDDGREVVVVRQALWRALLGVPFPCWIMLLLSLVSAAFCEKRRRSSSPPKTGSTAPVA